MANAQMQCNSFHMSNMAPQFAKHNQGKDYTSTLHEAIRTLIQHGRVGNIMQEKNQLTKG